MSSKSSYREEKVWKLVNFGPNFDNVCQQVCEQKVCDVISRKKKFQSYIHSAKFDSVIWRIFRLKIREFAVPTMAAATARAGHRTPMALYRYSFGLHLIWNRVFEPFGMDLWWKSQSRKCWPRSGFEDLIFFSVKWQGSSQLDSMKQFCFDEFFLSRNSNKSKIQIFRKNTADCSQI